MGRSLGMIPPIWCAGRPGPAFRVGRVAVEPSLFRRLAATATRTDSDSSRRYRSATGYSVCGRRRRLAGALPNRAAQFNHPDGVVGAVSGNREKWMGFS